MDHLQIIADALRLVIEQSHTGSGYLHYHVKSKDDGGIRHVTDSRNDLAAYLAEEIRVERHAAALDQEMIEMLLADLDLLEERAASLRLMLEGWCPIPLDKVERIAAVAGSHVERLANAAAEVIEKDIDPGGVVNVSDMALSAASAEAKAHRQDRLDLLEEFKPEDFKGLPSP